MQYDETIIHKQAGRWYLMADTLVAATVCLLGIIGAIGGAGYARWQQGDMTLWVLVGFVVGALLGFVVATELVLWLRFQAQMAMALAETERHTRTLVMMVQEELARRKPAEDLPSAPGAHKHQSVA